MAMGKAYELDDDDDPLEPKLDAARADLREEYLAEHSVPWIIGFSGGKDSTLVLQLVIEMLLELAPSERRRRVHVVCNDTLVEAPIVADHVHRVLDRIRSAVGAMRLPVDVVKTIPKPDQTFWVNLRLIRSLGAGWCHTAWTRRALSRSSFARP